MVSVVFHDAGALRDVFSQVATLAVEFDYRPELMPFYNLHYAAEDLRSSDTQWYWPAATRANIEQIMQQEAERFVARYAS
jgi:hypothetical protein